MPALVAFGRRWRLGSDDFVFPGITEAFVRLFWCALGSITFAIRYPLQCESAGELKELTVYLFILLSINLVTTVLCVWMAYVSSRGCIMDPRPRRSIANFIYLRLPLFLFEIVWTAVATYEVFLGYDVCHFITYLRVVISLEWILIIIVVIGLLFVFNPSREDDVEDEALLARRNWETRMHIFKIRQDARMRAALDDIANIISSFFIDRNIVISDIVAGLLLVVHSPNNEYPPTKKDNRETPEWMRASSALYYLTYAQAVYGWPTYLFVNRNCASYAALGKKVRCCSGMRCDQVLVVDDNCCLCNTAAFRLNVPGRNFDLFYVSFRNSLYQVPFVVLADHDVRSIVIAIRGSQSLHDIVTDLSTDDDVFTVDVDSDAVLADNKGLDSDDGSEVRVHRGMLQSARYIFDTIKKRSVLDDLMGVYPNYSLVVCGHSLGAGVASLLTLLLKQQFPGVHCFAFSPPGCVVSEKGQEEMEKCVMGIVAGDDIVPRISYQSMHKLREAIEIELRQSTRAKYEILIKGIFRLFFHAPWELTSPAPLGGTDSPVETDTLNLIRDGSASPSGYGSHVDHVAVNMRDERIQMELLAVPTPLPSILPPSFSLSPLPSPVSSPVSPTSTSSSIFTISKAPERTNMYPPGRLLHLHTASRESTEAEKIVNGDWIDFKCLSEIKLSTSVFSDHLPPAMLALLKKYVVKEKEEMFSLDAAPIVVTQQPTSSASLTR